MARDPMTPDEFAAYAEAVRWIVWGGIGTRRAGTLWFVELRRLDGDAWRLMDAD
jgi:hypothetical protein